MIFKILTKLHSEFVKDFALMADKTCKAAEYIGIKHTVQQLDQDTLIEQSLFLIEQSLK